LANFKHLRRVLFLDVKVKELMLKVLIGGATVDNAFFRSIDLEQEKHVMLIDLAVVIALH